MFLKNLMNQFSVPREEQFWNWFCENEKLLYDFESSQEIALEKIGRALNKVHSGLTFEIGPKHDDGKREFVISAEGIKNVFPAVESLHKKAPVLERWIFVKYRPRRSVDGGLKYKGKEMGTEDIKYLLLKDEDPNKLNIILFMQGFREEEKETFAGFGFLFLDRALGEYDVAMRINIIDFYDTDSEHYNEARPLSDLPVQFDYYFLKIKSRN